MQSFTLATALVATVAYGWTIEEPLTLWIDEEADEWYAAVDVTV